MQEFRTIRPQELTGSFFTIFDKRWGLVTAGNEESVNGMTISWGGLGTLWNKPAATVYIRPSRHTYGFVDREGRFSLCFFGEEHHEALAYCGRVSGRDEDKFARCGFTIQYADGIPYVAEAETVLLCKTIYTADFDPAHFVDPEASHHYPAGDYHRQFIAEITSVLVK